MQKDRAEESTSENWSESPQTATIAAIYIQGVGYGLSPEFPDVVLRRMRTAFDGRRTGPLRRPHDLPRLQRPVCTETEGRRNATRYCGLRRILDSRARIFNRRHCPGSDRGHSSNELISLDDRDPANPTRRLTGSRRVCFDVRDAGPGLSPPVGDRGLLRSFLLSEPRCNARKVGDWRKGASPGRFAGVAWSRIRPVFCQDPQLFDS